MDARSSRKTKDAGWTYLKLDFLYAGAQRGQRYKM